MSLTPKQRKALKALARRKTKPTIDFLAGCFPEQRAFLEDESPLKAALCTRRAGKSMGVGLDACATAVMFPGVSIGVIGLTRDSIRKIYFKDIMEVINRKFNLNMQLNKTELSYTFPNGSVIYFAGADANEEEMNKFLGQKYKKVYIDESSMYTTIDLNKLVYDVLEPAVADYRGQIILIGTPSNYLNSLFHKITDGREKGWSTHKWTWAENPHVKDQIDEQIARAMLRNPDIESTPGFQQHYRGNWVVTLDALVYKYNAKKNSQAKDLPRGYQYVLGVDLGWEDATAFVVGAWSHYDMQLHIIHVETEKHLKLNEVEDRMIRLQNTYNIGTIVVDGASKQGVETMQTRFKIALERADKQGKKDFIELMNMDFMMGNINVLPGKCADLEQEWSELIWNEELKQQGIWEELKSKPNHAADAALYMWRWCYNYAAIPKTAPPCLEDQMDAAKEQSMRQEDDDNEYSFAPIYEP